MAKKKRTKEDDRLPDGMSKRQAKLAARAAERASLLGETRPFGGLAIEPQLVALQEFVPSAIGTVAVAGLEQPVRIATVLPGIVLARVSTEGVQWVGLQSTLRSKTPGKDLATALTWLRTAAPGDALATSAAAQCDAVPALSELIDPSATMSVEAHADFNWWIDEDTKNNPHITQAIEAANKAILPSRPVTADVPGAAWWVDAGAKAHIRWVRSDDETALFHALARVSAAGGLHLGEDTKFAGVFRTSGVLVPVFDLDPTMSAEEFSTPLTELNNRIDAAYTSLSDPATAELSPAERRALETIKSREVTIRF